MEEYYKNGQLRIKIEKGSANKEFQRTRHKNYLNIPYKMYDKNGKLKEECFEDGTIEKYRENGTLREKCGPISGDEIVGSQCCTEYNEIGGFGFCSHWIA